MITYSKIYSAIELNKGHIINFLMDKNTINNEFINGLKEDFSFQYKYIEYAPNLDIQNIQEKSFIIVNYDRKTMNLDNMIGNNNVIILLLRDYYRTSNTELHGSAFKHLSNLIFILKDGKLKVLKSRVPTLLDSKTDKIVHIMKLLRSIKLNLISKK